MKGQDCLTEMYSAIKPEYIYEHSSKNSGNSDLHPGLISELQDTEKVCIYIHVYVCYMYAYFMYCRFILYTVYCAYTEHYTTYVTYIILLNYTALYHIYMLYIYASHMYICYIYICYIQLLVCGQALSHCVNFTFSDLLDEWPADKRARLVLLTDGRRIYYMYIINTYVILTYITHALYPKCILYALIYYT